MGSSDCGICGENDYLKEYCLDEMPKNILVCRNCVEEGIRLRIKQFEEITATEEAFKESKKRLENLKKHYGV